MPKCVKPIRLATLKGKLWHVARRSLIESDAEQNPGEQNPWSTPAKPCSTSHSSGGEDAQAAAI